MAVVTLTDRPMSVRNRCVIGGVILMAFFVLSRCFLDFSVGLWAFVIGLSQISSFFSNVPQFPPSRVFERSLRKMCFKMIHSLYMQLSRTFMFVL